MAHDSVLASPHRRSQGISPSFSVLIKRHQFLLTALILLTFLCSIYLYFAVTLGDTKSCFGLTGTDRELCRLKHAKHPLTVGKSKFI